MAQPGLALSSYSPLHLYDGPDNPIILESVDAPPPNNPIMLEPVVTPLPISWETHQGVPVRVNYCVHDLIEEQACRQPQAPAVCSWDGDLTYHSLHNISSQLAHHLREMGAGPEQIIPFCFEKSLWAVVALLAILKSGSAFVALDPSTPENRWAIILRETGAKVLLTSPSQASLFKGIATPVVIISQAFIDSLEEIEGKPCIEVNPGNAAFVLFTSGSTGQPKGIIQDHGAVCRFLPCQASLPIAKPFFQKETHRHIGTMCSSYGKALHLDTRCRVLQFASYNFDVSIVDMVDTLIHGACLCIPSEADRRDNIVDVINLMQVTWADLTPSFSTTFTPEDVPTLQTLVLAGEEVQREHIARWAGKVRLINCYGPAESSACTAYEYTSPLDQPGIIGYSMAHANCWVLDMDCPNELAPIGSTGELVVESPALARGYLNNPEKTEASFVEDPEWLRACGSGPGRRVYKTGDLVRYQPDGALKFVGRKDTQVKIRGQRVELSEVEHRLCTHPAISKCIIAYPKAGHYTERLVAVLQFRVTARSAVEDELQLLSQADTENIAFDPGEGTEYLRQNLPAYMIPTTWIAVETIPLTSSKKTDRRKVQTWLEALGRTGQFDPLGPPGLRSLLRLSPEELIALRISIIVAEMVTDGNPQLKKDLEGHDFALSAVGINSIQVISLSRSIEREFHAKIGVERLTNSSTTIRSLGAEVESLKNNFSSISTPAPVEVLKEVTTLLKGVFSPTFQPHRYRSIDSSLTTNVFLTGATGFLGTQILRQLLLQPTIKTVAVHIRAKTPEEGFDRTVEAAKAANCWSESFASKLEVWPGDLTKPLLGLGRNQWQRLAGLAPLEKNVHAIIHNGGVVRWNLDYPSLKAANTLATAQLLRAIYTSAQRNRLIYISGGQRLSFHEADDETLIRQVTRSNGYAQSKLVSELLVKQFAVREDGQDMISVIKPSYIIGTAADGIAKPSDYLWCLVVGAVEIGAFNANEADHWLFVSDVEHVARTAVQSLGVGADVDVNMAPSNNIHNNSNNNNNNHDAVQPTPNARPPTTLTTRILDGLPLHAFWHILTADFGYHMTPIPSGDWWARLRSHVEARGPSHCLWPFLYMLDEGTGEIGSAPFTPAVEAEVEAEVEVEGTQSNATDERIQAAIKMNIKYLLDIGFLPPPSTRVPDGEGAGAGQ